MAYGIFVRNNKIIIMKFGIIKERKSPPDRRVVFSPSRLAQFKDEFPKANIVVEASDIRIFPDDAYADKGFEIASYICGQDYSLKQTRNILHIDQRYMGNRLREVLDDLSIYFGYYKQKFY